MQKKYKKIAIVYCGLILSICAYVLIKTDIVHASLIRDMKQILVPSFSFDKNEKSFERGIVPLLEMDEDLLENGENDLSFDDFSMYQNDLVEGGNNDNTFEDMVATKTDAIIADEMNLNENVQDENTETVAVFDLLPTPNGIMYSPEQLSDYNFLLTNCYAVDSTTNVLPEELDVHTLLSKEMAIDISSKEPKVLIYHTHGSESFADSREGMMEDTVIGVGDELTRILQEDYGISVYHDRNIYDCVNGVVDRSYAYELAGASVDEILAKYPSIEVVLDIHRDGVREDVHLVKDIDGKPTAQIMFLNGMSRLNDKGDLDYLYNPYKIDNLAFSLQMHLIGKEYYGDLMRRIYVRGYCFNLNKMPRSSLIEVGAQTNTVEEAKNAMIPLGAILYKVLVAP